MISVRPCHTKPAARGVLLAALTLLAGAPRAQEPGSGGAVIPVRRVAGKVVARVRVANGDTGIPAHLVVDLGIAEELLLHANTAGLLEAEPGTRFAVTCGSVSFPDLVARVGRIRALEAFTAEHAAELKEVPAVGYLGLGAFRGRKVLLDLADGELRILPAGEGVAAPEPGRPVVRDPETGRLRVRATVRHGVMHLPIRGPGDRALSATLDTTTQDTWVLRQLYDTGEGLLLGDLRLDTYVPLRPGRRPRRRPGLARVVLGTDLLSHFEVTLDQKGGVVELLPVREPDPSEVDAEAFAALVSGDPGKIQSFLEAHGDHRLAGEAGERLLEMRLREDPLHGEALSKALVLRAGGAPPERRARVVLDILEEVRSAKPTAWELMRGRGLSLALEAAEQDEDPSARPKVQSEIGATLLEAGKMREAYRNLLSAALALKENGLVNLRLGRYYEATGKLARAWSRYLQAAITSEAGAEGLEGMKRLREEHGLERPFGVEELEVVLEGRVPAYQPASSYEPPEETPGRRVLVELFTGAHCPPCAAADLAFEGLAAHYGLEHVVLLQHHLPIPAPEPLVNPTALRRGRANGITATPTFLIDGRDVISGGGPTDQAAKVFRGLQEPIDGRLADPTPWKLGLEGAREGSRITVTAEIDGPEARDVSLRCWLAERTVLFPGRNEIVFHRYVTRAELPRGGTRIAEAAGARTVQQEVDLDRVATELERFLDDFETRIGATFSLRPTSIRPEQAVVVAFLEDAAGRVLQAAVYEVSPRSWR